MKAIVRAWWDVLKATINLARHTLRLFWRDPAGMLYAVGQHYLGDRDEAQRRIKKIEGR
jgi:uncharacterized protein YigE (DUF2233 family)